MQLFYAFAKYPINHRLSLNFMSLNRDSTVLGKFKKIKCGTLHMLCLFSFAVLIRPIGLEYKRKIGWFAQKTRAPETAEKVQLQSLFYSFLIVNCCYSGKKNHENWSYILNPGRYSFCKMLCIQGLFTYVVQWTITGNALGIWVCGCRCIVESSGSQNSGCT